MGACDGIISAAFLDLFSQQAVNGTVTSVVTEVCCIDIYCMLFADGVAN